MNPEKSLGELTVCVLEDGGMGEAEMGKAHSLEYRSRTHRCIP